MAGDAARARLRLSTTGRIYVLGAVVLAALIVYLLQAAAVTKASYDIQRLQGQQADLVAQQNQLRYQEASLQAPSEIGRAAASAGLSRALPAGYAGYHEVAIDLGAPAGQTPVDRTPPWQRGLMAVIGGRDVFASDSPPSGGR